MVLKIKLSDFLRQTNLDKMHMGEGKTKQTKKTKQKKSFYIRREQKKN